MNKMELASMCNVVTTILFSHDINLVTASFSHHCCNILQLLLYLLHLGPMLDTLDYTIRTGSTPICIYIDMLIIVDIPRFVSLIWLRRTRLYKRVRRSQIRDTNRGMSTIINISIYIHIGVLPVRIV